jgi:VanZ family protein
VKARLFFMKWLTVLFTVFIIAVVILADNGKLASLHFIYDFPNGDKAGHFILFGILAFLLDLTFFQALPRADRKRVAFMIGLVLALLIGLEEFSQKFIPERTSSLFDLLASYIGVFFFSWLALRIRPCRDVRS